MSIISIFAYILHNGELTPPEAICPHPYLSMFELVFRGNNEYLKYNDGINASYEHEDTFHCHKAFVITSCVLELPSKVLGGGLPPLYPT